MRVIAYNFCEWVGKTAGFIFENVAGTQLIVRGGANTRYDDINYQIQKAEHEGMIVFPWTAKLNCLGARIESLISWKIGYKRMFFTK